jgi:hypothetical protein
MMGDQNGPASLWFGDKQTGTSMVWKDQDVRLKLSDG